ncbi:hypothetical protein NL676_029995 [Syzygium grande]|nr:hypothetical protein NL676_029995 [Syzygium grande]
MLDRCFRTIGSGRNIDGGSSGKRLESRRKRGALPANKDPNVSQQAAAPPLNPIAGEVDLLGPGYILTTNQPQSGPQLVRSSEETPLLYGVATDSDPASFPANKDQIVSQQSAGPLVNPTAGEGPLLQPDSVLTTDQPRPVPLACGVDTIATPASLGTDRPSPRFQW